MTTTTTTQASWLGARTAPGLSCRRAHTAPDWSVVAVVIIIVAVSVAVVVTVAVIVVFVLVVINVR